MLAAVVAVGYLVIGVTHFCLPARQLQGAASLFASLARDGNAIFRVHYWAFAITSLLAMALVVSVRPERGEPDLFLQVARVWALLAFAVTAVDFLYVQQRALTIAEQWNSLDASSQQALLVLGTGRIDATWFIGFAALAPWPIALSRAARRSGVWPRATRVAAYLVSIDALCVSLGALAHQFLFVNLAAAGAIVVTPAFFVLMSRQSLRAD
ncbi:MAG: hypothetical protein JO197_06655 [Acidobacteria bacterium]|nr:hypothetical protein [Acidobacteriota bacterium]